MGNSVIPEMKSKPIEAIPFVWVEDVTERPELVDASNWICSHAYSKMYGNGRGPDQIYAEFANTANEKKRHILMAFGRLPNEPTARVLGTASYRLGSSYSCDGHPLEFMDLMKPECGWENYREHEFCANRIVEATRFAYADILDASSQFVNHVRAQVYLSLSATVRTIGQQNGCDQVWGILPSHVATFVRRTCGVSIARATQVKLNVDLQSHHFEICENYWKKGRPSLYRSGATARLCSELIKRAKYYSFKNNCQSFTEK